MALINLIVSYVFNRLFLCQLVATLSTCLAIRLLIYYQTRSRRYKLFQYYGIPGPKPNMWNGNFDLYRKDRANFLADDLCLRKYGKTYGIFIGDSPEIMSADLEFIRGVFLQNDKSFKHRLNLYVDTPLSDSVLFAKYDRWALARKLISPLFSAYKMRGSGPMEFVESSIKLLIEYIDQKSNDCYVTTEQAVNGDKIVNGSSDNQDNQLRKGSKGVQLDIINVFQATALHMIAHMAIPLPDVCVKEKEDYVAGLNDFLGKAGDGVVELAIQYPFIRQILEFIANNFEYNGTLARVRNCIEREIDEGLRNLKLKKPNLNGSVSGSNGSIKSHNDNNNNNNNNRQDEKRLIDLLIELHYKGRITRMEVIGNCLAMLVAGYDTTSTTLTYVFWCLAKYGSIQEKLREDLRIYGSESDYLDQVLSETMRLYPTVITFAARMSTETVDINGITIPQGVRVNYNAWIINRNPDIWPDPLEFDPDRFRKDLVNDLHPCAYAPFGLGARKCLGLQLAKLEMKMIICDLLMRYRIVLVSPEKLDLITHTNVLTTPREKVILEFHPV